MRHRTTPRSHTVALPLKPDMAEAVSRHTAAMLYPDARPQPEPAGHVDAPANIGTKGRAGRCPSSRRWLPPDAGVHIEWINPTCGGGDLDHDPVGDSHPSCQSDYRRTDWAGRHPA